MGHNNKLFVGRPWMAAANCCQLLPTAANCCQLLPIAGGPQGAVDGAEWDDFLWLGPPEGRRQLAAVGSSWQQLAAVGSSWPPAIGSSWPPAIAGNWPQLAAEIWQQR